MVDFFLSDFGQRVFRICVAESDRFPELGREFYANGPALARARMVEYFHAAEARGVLKIEDKELAADQFAELCKADLFPRLIFGIGGRGNGRRPQADHRRGGGDVPGAVWGGGLGFRRHKAHAGLLASDFLDLQRSGLRQDFRQMARPRSFSRRNRDQCAAALSQAR